jgi:hypothetical protein
LLGEIGGKVWHGKESRRREQLPEIRRRKKEGMIRLSGLKPGRGKWKNEGGVHLLEGVCPLGSGIRGFCG